MPKTATPDGMTFPQAVRQGFRSPRENTDGTAHEVSILNWLRTPAERHRAAPVRNVLSQGEFLQGFHKWLIGQEGADIKRIFRDIGDFTCADAELYEGE